MFRVQSKRRDPWTVPLQLGAGTPPNAGASCALLVCRSGSGCGRTSAWVFWGFRSLGF